MMLPFIEGPFWLMTAGIGHADERVFVGRWS